MENNFPYKHQFLDFVGHVEASDMSGSQKNIRALPVKRWRETCCKLSKAYKLANIILILATNNWTNLNMNKTK